MIWKGKVLVMKKEKMRENEVKRKIMEKKK